jgi:integrase
MGTKPLSVAASFPKARHTVPKVCEPGSPGSKRSTLDQECADVISRLEGLSKYFAMALYLTGARPREILNLTFADIDQRGLVYIKGLKGSKDRVVLCPPLLDLIPPFNPDPASKLFRSYSYDKFYRSYLRVHPRSSKGSGVHYPVGRLFRSAFARRVQSFQPSNIRLVTETLGHKSQTSTYHYLAKGGELNGEASRRNSKSPLWQSG